MFPFRHGILSVFNLLDSHQKRYVASRGENVIGVVIAKAGDTFRVDIGTRDVNKHFAFLCTADSWVLPSVFLRHFLKIMFQVSAFQCVLKKVKYGTVSKFGLKKSLKALRILYS
jgi:hypothetical protein